MAFDHHTGCGWSVHSVTCRSHIQTGGKAVRMSLLAAYKSSGLKNSVDTIVGLVAKETCVIVVLLIVEHASSHEGC